MVAQKQTKRSCRDKSLAALNGLPPFSPVLNRLLASLGQENVSFARLGDLIETDPVVAGHVLRIVNSAMYGRRGTINSVRHAIALLGLNTLRNAVLSMSISRMWNRVRTPPCWSMARFNVHSGATAMLADQLAQHLPVQYAEGAFVAGLFHDLGKLLMLLGSPAEYENVLKAGLSPGASALVLEEEFLGVTHPELSADAMRVWNLPIEIQTAVLHHHDPPPSDGVMTLSVILQAADAYINEKGLSVLDRSAAPKAEPGTHPENPPTPSLDCLAILGLGDRLPALVQDFETEFDAVSAYFR